MASQDFQSMIVGRWTNGIVIMEFFKDGTLTVSRTNQAAGLTHFYRFLDDDIVEMGDPRYPISWQSYKVRVDRDSLTLTQQRVGISIDYSRA